MQPVTSLNAFGLRPRRVCRGNISSYPRRIKEAPITRIAETIPELWLNRRGYFTIRGLKPLLKDGSGKIDLLGYHPHDKKGVHVEVSASTDASGFLGGETAARIREGVKSFVKRKYEKPNIARVRKETCPPNTEWEFVLAHGQLKREEEVRRALVDCNMTPVSLFEMFDVLSKKKEGEAFSYRTDKDAAWFAAIAHTYADRSESSG